SVVYWSRFFIALASGIGSAVALRGVVGQELATLVYTTLAVLVYGLTAAVYRNVLRYGEAQLKGKNRYITLGIGTFIFAWLASLVLTYTFLGLH
ncbi:hypothetical protein, partial [[Eubacterium] cellulosolvens]